MRFGLFGSAQARRGGPDADSAAGFREFIASNVEAEALGYHSTFLVEHHFTGFGQVSATLNLLTWVGARTTTLRLGTAVIVLAWHNPVLLAEQAATLDLLSGGRLDFGIGKGYRYNEFAGFCTPMEEADGRFDESLEVMLRAWTSDAPWSHHGTYWRFDNVVVEPPPARKPHPALWMGAGSAASIKKVAAKSRYARMVAFLLPELCVLCVAMWYVLKPRPSDEHDLYRYMRCTNCGQKLRYRKQQIGSPGACSIQFLSGSHRETRKRFRDEKPNHLSCGTAGRKTNASFA